MQKSNTAFTMIELVFVIVILGVLAAVAVPKLAATRNDAVTSRMAQNIMMGAGEIASFATATAGTDSNFSVMSNAISTLVDNDEAVLSNKKATMSRGNILDCVSIEVLSSANDENLTISFGDASGDSNCLSLQNLIDAQQYPMQLRGSLIAF